jgi:hypothetical protein
MSTSPNYFTGLNVEFVAFVAFLWHFCGIFGICGILPQMPQMPQMPQFFEKEDSVLMTIQMTPGS